MKRAFIPLALFFVSCTSPGTELYFTQQFCLPRTPALGAWKRIDAPEAAPELLKRAREIELGPEDENGRIGWFEDGAGRIGVCEMTPPAITNFVIFADKSSASAVVDHNQEITLIERSR